MCFPPAALMLASTAVSAAGTVMSGFQANAMGRYQAQVAKRNAGMASEAARDSIERGRIENRQLGRKVAATKGQQAAALAANGVDMGFGSAQRLSEDTAMLAREDQEALLHNVDQRTRGFDIQAASYVAEAKAHRYRGKQALIGSFFDAGSSLLSGMAQASSINAAFARPKPLGQG